MVVNMNFNDDPEKSNDEPSLLNENGDQQHNFENEQELVMNAIDMDEVAENVMDVTDEADPEYSSLDKQLDDLNSVLDILEQKNDHIQTQLKVLLENSREIRQNILKEKETGPSHLG